MKERSNIFNHIAHVVKSRSDRRVSPCTCSLLDLKNEFPSVDEEYLKECMRELYRYGTFRAGLTINKTPILIYDLPETNDLRTTTEQEQLL